MNESANDKSGLRKVATGIGIAGSVALGGVRSVKSLKHIQENGGIEALARRVSKETNELGIAGRAKYAYDMEKELWKTPIRGAVQRPAGQPISSTPQGQAFDNLSNKILSYTSTSKYVNPSIRSSDIQRKPQGGGVIKAMQGGPMVFEG